MTVEKNPFSRLQLQLSFILWQNVNLIYKWYLLQNISWKVGNIYIVSIIVARQCHTVQFVFFCLVGLIRQKLHQKHKYHVTSLQLQNDLCCRTILLNVLTLQLTTSMRIMLRSSSVNITMLQGFEFDTDQELKNTLIEIIRVISHHAKRTWKRKISLTFDASEHEQHIGFSRSTTPATSLYFPLQSLWTGLKS